MNIDWPLSIVFVTGWVAIVLWIARWVVRNDDRRDARRRNQAHPIRRNR